MLHMRPWAVCAVALGLALPMLPRSASAQAAPKFGQFHIGGYYGGWWGEAPLERGEVRTRQIVGGVVVSDTIQRDDPGQVNRNVESDLDIQQYGVVAEWNSPTLVTVGGMPLTVDVRLGGGYASLTNALTQRGTGAEVEFESDGPFMMGGLDLKMEIVPGVFVSVVFDADGSVGSFDATRSPALVSAPQGTRRLSQESTVREQPETSYVRWRVTATGAKNFDFDRPWFQRLTVRAGVGWEDISYDLENRVTRPGVQGVTVVQTGETERADSGVFGTVGLSARFRKWLAAHTDFRVSGDSWGVVVRALFGF